MIRLVLLTMIIPLLSCCSNTESKEQKLSAQTTADITRAHWEKAKKPFAITFKDNPEYSRLSEIEVKVDLQDATDEERHALQGVTFKSNNEIYTSSARAALTTDTTATIYACFPYRKELKDRDVIELAAPFGENLFATEVARTFGTSTNVNMKMQSSMAMLRIICESNNVKDMLDELKIAGDEIYISGEYQPFKGTWINKYIGSCLKATDANCLLNNGRKHDIYMIPTNKSSEITLFTRINNRSYAVKTTLPRLNAGSMIQLNVRKDKKGLSIISSWVENERTYSPKEFAKVDTVKVGHFLQNDGYIKATRDSNSIACVIETDGTHGKAIALTDARGRFCFSSNSTTSRKLFPTVDGKRKEGIINPNEKEGLSNENIIIYKPKMPFPESCALGYPHGELLTNRLTDSLEDLALNPLKSGIARKDMLLELHKHPGSYIPSLAEMTKLYYRIHPLKCSVKLKADFALPFGEYITSTEQTEQSAYMIDFTQGVITGGLSKQYSSFQLRLFYLF